MTTKTMDSESYLANIESADIANSKFVPTKEELEELHNLGFRYMSLFNNCHGIEYLSGEFAIKYWYSGCFSMGKYNTVEIYPQSIEDIRTLIRLLTPQ